MTARAGRPLDVDTLWRIARLGVPALAPDGRHAVCSVTQYAMDDNSASSRLWLLATDGSAPRPLTRCGDKDGQPAWSPRGDRIAFIARRRQQGSLDGTPQLYTIAPDGGEAVRASNFAPGVASFRWLPDGRRIVFAAWVWPALKGAAAQACAHKAFAERKESGYATSDAFYRHWDHELPMGRVLHLLLLDLRSSGVRDLFEGTRFELPRDEPGHAYDVHPDGRRIAFVHDPAAVPMAGNRLALAEIDIASRRVRTLVDDAGWDLAAPRYSPQGERIAVIAANVGRHHTAPGQLALVTPAARAGRRWQVLGADWDHAVDAPLRWSADGQALLFCAEQRGRCHLWRHARASGAFDIVHAGGWVQGFDVAGDMLVVAADAAAHPVRIHARRGAAAPLRLEDFNDKLLAGVTVGAQREVEITGAQGDTVQMWLNFPPGFDAAMTTKKHPLLHVIHGGPHAAAGDTFSYRWNTQVLASQGHVVARVNYHGSSGFGFAFKHSLIGRQGLLELQDIEAGTDWLLRQPWADAGHVYAAGGSYGGFLVAWMNGHLGHDGVRSQSRYRAYICHAGVFDRIATFSADSYPVRPKDLQATYWQDMPKVLAQSPHAFADRMATPTLVIHGARDYRVPDCNGLAYYNTLKARGVAARLLWFPDENHWVLRPRNARLWHAEFFAWLAAQR